MKTAVIYVRVSSKEQQQEGFSIPAQRKLLEAYAKDQDFSVLETYEDVETAKRAGRRSFGKMVEFLRKHTSCKAVLVEKTDRLYRNFEDAVTMGGLDVDLHFVKEGTIYNRETKSSEKLQHDLKLVIAKNYIDNLAEETSKGLLEKARQGLYPSMAPLGYLNDRNTRTIVLDPERAPMVRRLFEEYASSTRVTLKDLVKLADNMGLRSRKGNKIGKAAIAHLLHNPILIGDYVWKGVYYHGKHEPLVTRELFNRVQERFKAWSYSGVQHKNHPFRGLVRCGNCGCLVTPESHKGKFTYYHCTHARGNCKERSLNEPDLAAALGEPLKRLRLDPERVDWILKALQDADRENDQKRQEARQRLERDKRELERKLDVLYEDKLSGSIDEDFWKRKQQEYRTRLSWIEDNLQRGEQDSGERLANAERIIELSQKAYSLYLTQDMDEKRKLLDLLLLNSTMKDRKVESTLRHPFDIIADGAIEEEQMRHKKRPEKAINENWLLR